MEGRATREHITTCYRVRDRLTAAGIKLQAVDANIHPLDAALNVVKYGDKDVRFRAVIGILEEICGALWRRASLQRAE